MFDDCNAIFDSLIDATLPCGEGAVVAFAHVYFDESGTHTGSRVMAMAGYWFDADQARKFSRDWAKELVRFGLPAAHMTDCALGFGDYKDMTVAKRVEIEKSLIALIKRRSKFSICICINQNSYERILADVAGMPSAYTLMLLLCVNKIAEQIKYDDYKGRVAYFFEAGHQHANEANRFMNAIPSHQNREVDTFRYASHSFVDKRIALPLQAADMLVWQQRHYFERMMDGHTKPRKDFVALIRPHDVNALVTDEHMMALRQLYLNAYEIFGESLIDPTKPAPGLHLAEGIARAFGLNLNEAAEVRARLAKGDF